MIKTRFKYSLLIMALSCICVLTLSSCGSKNKDIDLTNCIVTSTISYSQDKWEVYKETEGENVYVFKNGELDTQSKYNNQELKAMLSLPSVEESKDLDKSNIITKNTYKVGIVASLEYVNYLKESGYEIEFEAKTPEFYEVYFKSDKMDKYKRLIVTKEYVIEYNTDNINFKIDDYII